MWYRNPGGHSILSLEKKTLDTLTHSGLGRVCLQPAKQAYFCCFIVFTVNSMQCKVLDASEDFRRYNVFFSLFEARTSFEKISSLGQYLNSIGTLGKPSLENCTFLGTLGIFFPPWTCTSHSDHLVGNQVQSYFF